MAIKLENENLMRGLHQLIGSANGRNEFLSELSRDFMELTYYGNQRDAVEDNFKLFEQVSNGLIDVEDKIIKNIKTYIEISDTISEAAYMQGKVNNVSFNDDIQPKKGSDIGL